MDRCTNDYLARLKFLFPRLDLPASYDESVVVFTLTQRVLLELDARLTWLIDIRKIHYDLTVKRSRLRNVVGALTDSLDVANNLFRVRYIVSIGLIACSNVFLVWCSSLALKTPCSLHGHHS